jgi:hypothetical protein
MTTADIVMGALCLATLMLLAVFVYRVSTGGSSDRGAGPGFLTGFQDLQPKDKQEAIEVIIREKAGKKSFADGTNAAPGKDGQQNEPEQTDDKIP